MNFEGFPLYAVCVVVGFLVTVFTIGGLYSSGNSLSSLSKRLNALEVAVFTDPVVNVVVEDFEMSDGRLVSQTLETATEGSAGFDIVALIKDPIVLQPGETFKLNTYIKIGPEETNLATLIIPRSGAGSNGLVLANTVGLIDSDYRGYLYVNLLNRSNKPYTINPLDKVCQILFTYVVKPRFFYVNELEETERGDGGFGSTGK